MYCWSCGHKNPDNNKFCGDCGKAQVRPPVFVDEDAISDNVRTMNPPVQERPRVPEKRVEPVTPPVIPPPGTGITPTPQRFVSTNPLIGESRVVRESPLSQTVVAEPVKPTPVPGASRDESRSSAPGATRISGPSFLGLSDAPEASSTPSEYLLDDDQESSSTARSYIALGLILLLGVLLYKQWDTVSAAGRDLMQRATSVAPATSGVPTRQAEIASTEPTKGSVYHGLDEEKPERDKVSAEETAADEKAATDAAKSPTDTESASASKDAAKSESQPAAPAGAAAAKAVPEKSVSEPSGDREAAAAAPAAPVYDDSQVELAQKYLQGRGVAQDCNRGVRLLRSAAAQPNPKAQIKLGALYATGHCVTQDRAEAYRWFAEAHQLQPGNQWIDKNLNSLWAEMTPVERGRAQR